MARDPLMLTSAEPTAIAPANVHIGHVQLRDLIICPRERGIVNYVHQKSIVEKNLHAPHDPPRNLVNLSFTPNCLTFLPIGQNDTLLAAGGQEAEIHLSYHHHPSSSSSSSMTSTRSRSRSTLLWQFDHQLHGSINNSVLLTSLSLTRSNESAVEPRVGISNNDNTVKLYDVPLRGTSSKRSIKEAGCLRLDVPINHSSISPDGRTLLSVGDSTKVYIHRISGGAKLTFTPTSTLIIPAPDFSQRPSSPYFSSAPSSSPSSLAASFSTAFSNDGSKFAVASQEGVVAVWDVRSSRPLKVMQTDKTRVPSSNSTGSAREGGTAGSANGSATGWLSDDPFDWARGKNAPGWSVRSVKFGNGGEAGNSGKEVLCFTEHTSLVHVVDARTFEPEQVIRVPSVRNKHATTTNAQPAASPSSVSPPTSSNPPHTRTGTRRARSSSTTTFSITSRLASPPPLRTTNSTSSPSTSSRHQPQPPAAASHTRAHSQPFPLPAAFEDLRVQMGLRNPPSSSSSSGEARFVSSPRRTTHPGIVQALGDAFRIPSDGGGSGSGSPFTTTATTTTTATASPRNNNNGGRPFSPPSSISDSTWRTLRMSTIHANGALTSTAASAAERERERDREMERDIERELSLERQEREYDEYRDLLVIPSLGDRDVESEVHALLESHGIPARMRGMRGIEMEEDDDGRMEEDGEEYEDDADADGDGDPSTGSTHADYRYRLRRRRRRRSERDPMSMDVDGSLSDDDDGVHQDDEEEEEEEEEHECHTPSRSTSPSPPTRGSSHVHSHGNNSQYLHGHPHPHPHTHRRHTSSSSTSRHRHQSTSTICDGDEDDDEDEDNDDDLVTTYTDDLDLAGMCFDPTGGYLYVGSTEGVVEWEVRGSEKRWWAEANHAGGGVGGRGGVKAGGGGGTEAAGRARGWI